MRQTLSALPLILLLAVGVAFGASHAEGWPEPPEGTEALVLITGADIGQYYPRGCFGNTGGAVYRKAFDAWLEQSYPSIPHVWLSTGEVVPDPEDEHYLEPAEPMLEYLGEVGYAVVGVGERELEHLGPTRLAKLGQRFGLQFVSSNLQVFETGAPALYGDRVVEVGSSRIGVVVASPHLPERIWGGPKLGSVVTVQPVEALARRVAALRSQGADQVILLATSSSILVRRWLREVDGVDAAFGSHGNRRDVEPKTYRGVPVLWLGALGQTLGRIALGGEGQILEIRGIPVSESFPVDPSTGEVRALTSTAER